MHNIFDLNEMDIEQVRSIAKELGIHINKKMEKKDIAYLILDKEAAINAHTPQAEKPKKCSRISEKDDNPNSVPGLEWMQNSEDSNSNSIPATPVQPPAEEK